MADDKSKRGPADAKRVNVHESYEVEYWTKKFGCTKGAAGGGGEEGRRHG